ncbi:MAG: hypothetical protein J0L84_04705 [Verrucomicrobia bacterium]|nr:hypothetical protein [Verrucomicrobiota bacterium]
MKEGSMPWMSGRLEIAVRSLLLATALMPCAVAQEPATDFPRVGAWPGYVRGSVLNVAPVGSHLVCSLDLGGIGILDPTSETNSGLVRLAVAGGCHQVEAAGSVGYLALGPQGLGIADLADPKAPRLLTSVSMPHPVYSLALGEGVAVVSSGLLWTVLDLANPKDPVVLGTYRSAASPQDLHIHARRLYAVLGDGTLEVFDLAGRTAPSLLGRIKYPGFSAIRVAVRGLHAFVAVSGGGILVLDVSNPESMHVAEQLPAGGRVNFGLQGNRLVTWDERGEVRVWDVANPLQPALLSRQSFPEARLIIQRPAVVGDQVWFHGATASLRSLRIDGDGRAVLDRAVAIDTGESLDLAFEGDHLFVADGSGGLVVLEGPRDGGFREIGRFQTNLPVTVVRVADSRAAILAGGRISILDVQDPGRMVLLGPTRIEEGSPPVARTLAFAAGHLFLGGFGLAAGRLEDLPVLRASFLVEPHHPVHSLVLHNGHLYACGNFMVWIIAVNAPDGPRLIGHYIPTGTGGVDIGLRAMSFIGDFGFAALDPTGLDVLDLADPVNPRLLGRSVPEASFGPLLPHGHRGIGVVNGLLSWLDLAPTGAVTVQSTDPEATAGGRILKQGNRVLVADGFRGVVEHRLPPTGVVLHRTPSARKVATAQGLELVVEPDGSEPVSITWMRNGFPVKGAGGNVLRIPAAGHAATGIYSVVVSNALALVRGPDTEVRPPAEVELVEAGRVSGVAGALAASGEMAAAVLGRTNVVAFAAQPGAAPREIWRRSFPFSVHDLGIYRDWILVTGPTLGLTALDAFSGRILAKLSEAWGQAMQVSGDLAYLAGDGQLVVYDLARRQVLTPSLSPAHSILRMAGSDRMLVTLAPDGRCTVWKQLPSEGPAMEIMTGAPGALAGGRDWAAVSDGAWTQSWPVPRDFTPGVQLLDLSDPWFPRSRGRHATSGTFAAMAISGSWLYGADPEHGLQILDCSDLTSPLPVTDLPRTWSPVDLAVTGHRIWVSEATEGVLLFEVLPNASPRLTLDALANGEVFLQWPAGIGATLRRAAGLDAGAWSDAGGDPAEGSLRLPTDDGESYFHLGGP